MTKNNEEFTDFYAVLGVDSTAHSADIRRAYLLGAKEHHPVAGGSAEKMHLLSEAYKTLASEASRTAYDKLYALYTGTGDGLDWRDHDTAPKTTNKGKVTDNDDLFVDQLYSEYVSEDTSPKLKNKFKRFFKD